MNEYAVHCAYARRNVNKNVSRYYVVLGGVMGIVLAIGAKVSGFKSGRGPLIFKVVISP
jgi:hypothetical protein